MKIIATLSRKIVKHIYNCIVFIIGIYYKTISNNKIILFESLNGFDGNSGEIYDYLRKKEEYKKYIFVWFVNEKKDYYEYNNKKTYVYTHNEKSFMKYVFLRSATIAFYDNVPMNVKNKKAKLIYLTHGCPGIKNVKGIINLPARVDYVLTTSENLVDYSSKMFGYSKEKAFINGLPRNDVLANLKIENTCLFDKSKYEKVIIWLPTFRKSAFDCRDDTRKELPLGIPCIKTHKEYFDLNSFLKKNNTLLLLKLHPGQNLKIIDLPKASNIFVFSQDDIQRKSIKLYSIFHATDALLTDYSSVVFDYMLLNKPIGFIIDDINDYKLGIEFPSYMNRFPGKCIKSIKGIKEFIKDVCKDRDEYKLERKRISEKSNKYNDGKNCERIAKMFCL